MSKKWYEYFVTVEGEAGAPGMPASPQTPGSGKAPPPSDAAQTIAQLAASIAPPPPPARFEASAAAASKGAFTTFEEIYSAADIKAPPHGYTILKIADMLNSEHIRALPPEVKKGSIMVALDAAGVKIQEVIQDAVRRDQALDAFERVRMKSVDDLEARKIEENRKIQADMDKYVAEQKARLQSNLADVEKQKEGLKTWLDQKRKEEQRIADCVSYFVTDNPISTGAGPRPAGNK